MIIKNIKRYKHHIENLLNVKKTVHNKKTGETALTTSHTLPLRQPADNWELSGEVGNNSPHTVFNYIYAFPACIYPLICTNLVLR